jgi:hypothetical protein
MSIIDAIQTVANRMIINNNAPIPIMKSKINDLIKQIVDIRTNIDDLKNRVRCDDNNVRIIDEHLDTVRCEHQREIDGSITFDQDTFETDNASDLIEKARLERHVQSMNWEISDLWCDIRDTTDEYIELSQLITDKRRITRGLDAFMCKYISHYNTTRDTMYPLNRVKFDGDVIETLRAWGFDVAFPVIETDKLIAGHVRFVVVTSA